MLRRTFIQTMSAMLAMLLVLPARAFAAVWNTPAFASKTLQGALDGMHIAQATVSDQIQLMAPDMAENGAVVQVEVLSRIAGTESIAILVDKNPTPLIANFSFSNGAEPYVVTRIKMAETAEIQAIVKVGKQYYKASKRVEVQEGGCN